MPEFASSGGTTPFPFPVVPGDIIQFPRPGWQSLTATLIGGDGQIIETAFWSFNIVDLGRPSYLALNPQPAPANFPNTPILESAPPSTITVTITNPTGDEYLNKWYLDGVEDLSLRTNQSQPPKPFVIDPATIGLLNHTVTNQITLPEPDDNIIIQDATWNFSIRTIVDPQFSTFSGQQPAPTPMPDVIFGSGTDIPLQPDTLINPDLAAFVIEWQLDGDLQASDTFFNTAGNNATPTAFIIDPNDALKYDVGTHSIVASIRDTLGGRTIQTANWTFEVVFPPPTTIIDVMPEATATVVAISSVPMDATGTPGFYQDPPTDNTSRGTPLVIGTDTFCVEINNADGVGFPDPRAGVQIVFEDSNGVINNNGVLIYDNSVSPPKVCLDGTGATPLTQVNGVPDYTLNLSPPEARNTTFPTFITATVTDILSLQEVGVVQWSNVTIEPANTPPSIEILTGGGLIEDGDTVPQDATITFSYTIADKDSRESSETGWDEDYSVAFSFTSPLSAGVPLDGTSTFYGGGSAVTPDCWRDVADLGVPDEQAKFTCTLAIPSSSGNSPVSTTGTYRILAFSQDTQTNTIGVPENSNLLTWNLNVAESNTTPTVLNFLASSPPPASSTVDSYVHQHGDDTVAITTANEEDTIVFNLHIDDFEKDDFYIQISHNSVASPTEYVVIEPPPPATPTVKTMATDSYVQVSYTIPDTTVLGQATATINYRVQVQDIPDTATPLTYTLDIPLLIVDVNPPPVLATNTVEPPMMGTPTVVEGFPYSFYVDGFTDASSEDGAGIEWQWEVSSDCAVATSTSWQSIIGADEGTETRWLSPPPVEATLTWSPPAHLNNVRSCFRNCVGDDGFGNPKDCTTLEVGPWDASLTGFIKGVWADSTFTDVGILQANVPHTDIWMDEDTRTLYTVHARNNVIQVASKVYNMDGTITEDFQSFATNEAAPNISETPYDISITGNDTHIFIGYAFNEVGGSSGTPLGRLSRINIQSDLASGTRTTFEIPSVISGLGQVVANDFGVWLPYIKKIDDDKIYYIFTDGASDAADTPLENNMFVTPADDISVSSIITEKDPNAGNMIMAARLKSGELNLYQFSMPNASGPLVKQAPESLDIYDGQLFNFYTLGVGNISTNQKSYVVAQDIENNLIFKRFLSSNLSEETGVIEFSKIDHPEILFLVGIQVVPAREVDTFYLGTIAEDLNPPFHNAAYTLKIVDEGQDYDPDKDLSKRVSRVSNIFQFVSNNSFALSLIDTDFEIGTAGANPGENIKDTLWFRYIDNSSTRTTILNVEPETFSGNDPLSPETNSDWTRPWFKK
jgi:hypothetical protein